MPVKLTTTIKKIADIPNSTNSTLLSEFYQYMKSNGASDSHLNNNLKALTSFAHFLGSNVTFYDIKRSDMITHFLDTKIKSLEDDPDKKCIITWNDYLGRIKYFMRWLHTYRRGASIHQSDWITPAFSRIKEKKTRRLSPYSETELWEREEILSIVKYEPYKRNKAALTMFWDLDARNHEVTLLKIKHIRLRERYGEGEIPHEAKTGSGPALLTCSFPYVRDWINEHPFKNEPEARLICNLHTGAPVKPDAMWKVMKQLRDRIIRLLESGGSITNEEERQKLEFLLKTKKWNPYCIRHSAITSDSDFLPEYALKKKVRWSMNYFEAGIVKEIHANYHGDPYSFSTEYPLEEKLGKEVKRLSTVPIGNVQDVYNALTEKETLSKVLEQGLDEEYQKYRDEGIKPWHMYVQVRALENRIPIAAPNVCDSGNSIYKGKSIFVDFDYDYKTDIAVPKLRFGSSVNDQILIMDIDLKRTRKLHKKRFEDFRNNLYGLL